MVNDIAKYIDYTLLKQDASADMFKKLCGDAVKNGFYSVCVPPYYVKGCAGFLKDSGVKVVTVIGFPLGYNASGTKVFETAKAIEDGADEIDAVMNVSAFKSGNFDYVLDELKEIRKASQKHILKIIIETCCLNNDDIIKACAIVSESGADFIKTSTGFASGGAKTEDIRLMKQSLSGKVRIKASGGIKTFKQACEFIEAGATRIGTSSILIRSGINE